MSAAELPLGTIVEVPVGRGIVRFSGSTTFKPGKWIGIELFEQNGKNDGSIGGVAYFTCRVNYGVFVRPSNIKGIFGHERDSAPAPTKTLATRPSFGHQRTSSLRSNSARTTSPSTSSPRSVSPSKNPASPGPSSKLARPGQNSPTKRVSLQRKSFSTRQPSLQAPSPPSPIRPRSSGSPTKTSPPTHTNGVSTRRVSSPLSVHTSPSSQQLSVVSSPQTLAVVPSSPEPTLVTAKPPSPLPHIVTTRQVDDQELQELRAKIRVLEAKRGDDSRHVRELETRLSEAELFVSLRPKLQAKLQSQQTELIAARRELADAQQLADLNESRVLDAQEQLEMAMLDKEVAEEKSEMAEAELEEIKERLAIAEVELEVMKAEIEGAGELGESGDAGKDSLAYIQLEKQNERLKEALLRLRDITQETELEQRRRIAEMEKDLTGVEDVQTKYDSAAIKLANAEIQIEDLKLQLDDALGAEDMLVQLTERNLMLGEKIEEMRITIEDLESLKELNDELEENHMETEKSLLEDIEIKDSEIRQQVLKVEVLQEACQDLENTIEQFRDLVLRLQNELNELRDQTQTAQSESATAASQTAAMMSLNLKLQSSAAKNQAKHIDLEVATMEAKESKELLSIIQPYLPQLYVESDSDATSCYLFFQRLAYKTDLINSVIADIHGLPKSLSGAGSEILVGVCEMRGRISSLSTLCKRFTAILKRCDVQSFLNIGRLYPEIAPMEKRIDMHIDLLRRDEFREMECVSDIVKIQSQFDHIAETYFSSFEHDIGERELGYANSFDLDLDVFSAAINLIKTSISVVVKDEEVEMDMGGLDIETQLYSPLQKLLDLYQSAKVQSKKLARRMDDLLQNSSALKATLIPQMNELSNSLQEPVNFAISLAQLIMPHLSDVRTSKSPFRLSVILDFVKQVAEATAATNNATVTSWQTVENTLKYLIQQASTLQPLTVETENVLKVSGISPWVTRVDQIKSSLAVNLEAERKVAQLNDEIQGLLRNLKTKDQTIQESSVKIELQERRLEGYKKQDNMIDDLQTELSKSRKQEHTYEEAMEQLQSDFDTLEQEFTKFKAQNVGQERQPAPGVQVIETESLPVEGNLETSYLLEQIEALRGTVRFLRTENFYIRGQDLLKEIQALPPLPEPITRPPTPLLVPSALSDTDESDDESLPPPTLYSLATETKLLFREVVKFSSSPKIVDLSVLNAKRVEANGGKVWMPRKKMPAHQVLERKLEAQRLSRRVRGLLERANIVEL